MSRSQVNPLHLQTQQEVTTGRQQENLPTPDTNPPTANLPLNNELEALRQANQRLFQQNKELLNLIHAQHPQRAQQAHNDLQWGEHQCPNPLRDITEEDDHNQSLGNICRRIQRNEEDEEMQSQNRGTNGNELPPFQQEWNEQF